MLLGLELNFLDKGVSQSSQMDVEFGIETMSLESPSRIVGKKMKKIKVMELGQKDIRKIKIHSMFEENY